MVRYDSAYYNGSNVWNNSTYLRFDVNDLLLLKKLKSVKIKSAYIDTILAWKKEDNEMPVKHIATLLYFMTKLVDLTPGFIKKYNVKKYHINLIRRLYIEYDNYMAIMDYKRPYGNSFVLWDIYKEYSRIMGEVITFEDIPEDYKNIFDYYDEKIVVENDIVEKYIYDNWINDNKNFLLNIHNEVMNIFDAMTHELEFKSLEYVQDKQKWNVSWKPTEKGKKKYLMMKRKNKLKKILK